MERQELIKKKIKKIVVKVGTSFLTDGTGHISKGQIDKITNQLSELKKKGFKVVLVTSGAIASGVSKLKMKNRPEELPLLQSCAAVGQSQLMRMYDESFSKTGLLTAQVLLTREDISDRNRYLNARNTLLTLLEHNTIPIVNENDTVSVEEIKFGENDKLAALVANLIEADMLILLSNVEGLCLRDGDRTTKEVIGVIKEITNSHRQMACGPGALGTGGMSTKLEAAEIAVSSGIYTVIANGSRKNVISDILSYRAVGTLFLPTQSKLASRKKWIAFAPKAKGTIIVDEGAKTALLCRGKSLLAAGVRKIKGKFSYGDSVILADEKNVEFARGLTNYSSQDLEKIKGKKTKEIEVILGHTYYEEVIHRDNLALLKKED